MLNDRTKVPFAHRDFSGERAETLARPLSVVFNCAEETCVGAERLHEQPSVLLLTASRGIR